MSSSSSSSSTILQTRTAQTMKAEGILVLTLCKKVSILMHVVSFNMCLYGSGSSCDSRGGQSSLRAAVFPWVGRIGQLANRRLRPP